MLSRHFLRAKSLQSLYAAITARTTDEKELVRIFEYNVNRLNKLGMMQLSTLPQLAFTDERVIENATQKMRSNPNDRNLSMRFAENRFIRRLSEGFEYKQTVSRMHIDWANHFDIFRRVLNQLKESKPYKEYIALEDSDFESDKQFALVAFKFLMNDETLRDNIFDRDLIWEDDFDQIAQYLFMMMKELNEETMDEAMRCPLVLDMRNTKDTVDYEFALDLATGAFNHLDDNEPLIRKHLQNWDMERVALMDLLLINMAMYEFTSCPSIPERVTVDEYIELSKEFSTEKSKLFINGILDKILIELRAAGRIEKDERGMFDPKEAGMFDAKADFGKGKQE